MLTGRWSAVPRADLDPTAATAGLADQLLERYGVVTKGAVAAEEVPGGFSRIYKALSAFEESGRARRGYFIEHLGAAQFARTGTVDALRASEQPTDPLVLAATDPANPYGAALPWPERSEPDGDSSRARPGRKAGALVVLDGGRPALFVERGGRTVLTFDVDPAAAVTALATVARERHIGSLTVERIDGEHVHGHALAAAFLDAGFGRTPKGLRLR